MRDVVAKCYTRNVERVRTLILPFDPFGQLIRMRCISHLSGNISLLIKTALKVITQLKEMGKLSLRFILRLQMSH
jgi:hypothetical protein